MFYIDQIKKIFSQLLCRTAEIWEYLLLRGWNSKDLDNFKLNMVSNQLINDQNILS